jgi:hypothetical protein
MACCGGCAEGKPCAGLARVGVGQNPVVPSRNAAVGAFSGGILGAVVGLLAGAMVEDSTLRGSGDESLALGAAILTSSAVTLLGATLGAWLLTPSTPVQPPPPAPSP